MSDPRPSKSAAPDPLDEAAVIAWLRRHPDILVRHPEICAFLLPPEERREGANVVELQRFLVQRLRGELKQASDLGSALLDASRQNMAVQTRVHAATLALLDATGFEHLVHIATQDWTDILDVDVVSICVEGDPARTRRIAHQTIPQSGVFVVPEGSIDQLLGPGVLAVLRAESGHAERLYGPAADLVKSDALARLDFGPGAPVGMLALGTRKAGSFQPTHGTELLQFLARVLERSVRGWLGRGRK